MIAPIRSLPRAVRLQASASSSYLSAEARAIGSLPRTTRSFTSAPRPRYPNSQPPPSPAGKPTSSTVYEKQRRREWLIIAISGSIAAGGAYYWYNKAPSASSTSSSSTAAATGPFPTSPSRTQSFGIAVRGPSGERINKVLTMLPASEVDRRLRANEATTTLNDKPEGSCLVARYDTNSVASNDPIEDRRAEAIVERDRALTDAPTSGATIRAGSKGDLAFFAVMDGHSGYDTSTYLSQKLIAFVALELEKVFRETGEYAQIASAKNAMPSKLWSILSRGSSTDASAPGLDGDPDVVKRAITKAFVGLDKEIVNTPLELLKEYEVSRASGSQSSSSSAESKSLSSLAHSIFPSPGASKNSELPITATKKSAYETMLPAMSGSCALLTYIDSARKDVFVACTGDSRAIAGWYSPSDDKWTIEPLSTDQTGRNPSEQKRMQAEHPASEAETVVMRGRVLGGLEPTRAFGDARYKWSRDVQQRLSDAFLSSPLRTPPRHFQTPPYVTARPEVEWRRLPGGINDGKTKQLKFIVMATDGLWDMLSNEEVGTLVVGHLNQVKGDVKATDLQSKYLANKSILPAALTSTATTETPAQQIERKQKADDRKKHPLSLHSEPSFTFQDENLATHLVRNALGGGNSDRVAALLAIPAPDARRFRDDITVNVILLNDSQTKSTGGDGAQAEATPKAKL